MNQRCNRRHHRRTVTLSRLGGSAMLILVVLVILVSVASAAAVVLVDDGGADDEPGQKDLSQLTVDYANLPTSLGISWNWDDTAWSGANTGDACSLYDTDDDGDANYSLCVTVSGSPATYQATRLYSCGDDNPDRCSQPTTVISSFNSTCSAGVVADSDPFGMPSSPNYDPGHVTGNTCSDTPDCYTDDTVASCTVDLSDFAGAADAFLLNVCSYPSEEPNSDPSDCVVAPGNGFLTIIKIANPDDATQFQFTLNPAAQDGTTVFSISGSGAVELISVAPGTYSLTETVPVGWNLDDASCTVNGGTTGSFNGTDAVTGIEINSGQQTVCSFTDTQQNPALTLVKTATPTIYDEVGDVIEYSYELINSGNVTLEGPFGVDDDKATVTCPGTATLAPEASITCNATYVISQEDLDAGSVTNTAQAKGFFDGDPVLSNQDSETVTADQVPILTLVKTATPTSYAEVGDVIDYSYELTNSGNVTLEGPFGVDDDKATVTCPSTATLAPGASITCSATYAITQDDLNAGSVTNTAQAKGFFDGDPISSNFDSAVVTRVNLRISITPGQATNAVGDPHTFVVTVEQNTGAGWTPVVGVNPVVTVAPAPGSLANNCALSGTDASGQCTVVINSTMAGVYTASATATVSVSGVSITRTTGDAGNTDAGGTGPASKTYVDLRVSITPGQATNHVGNPHTFVVTVEQNTGAGWTPVVGVNPVVTVTPAPSSVTDNCALSGTDASGQCTVVINSTMAGAYTASATVTVSVGGVSITRITGNAGNANAGGTGPASKTYVDLRISITPGQATNEVGDPHTFVVKVEQNTSGGWTPVPGVYPDVTVSPAPTILVDNCDVATGTGTDAAGECTVEINSNVVQVYTAAASVTADVGGVSITRSTDQQANIDAGGTGPATKTYSQANIELVKTVSLNGACPGADPVIVQTGTLVTYCYEVTNTGTTHLVDIQVTDDKLGAICIIPGPLVLEASATCTKTATLTADTTNLGTTVGTPSDPSGNPLGLPDVSDEDPALVLVVQRSAIGDFVWYDANADGIQGIGEPGIPNVAVDLYLDANTNDEPDAGELLASTITDADGGYIFKNLEPANYIVDVRDAPNANGPLFGLSKTAGPQSVNDPLVVTLAANQVFKAADFGYVLEPPSGAAVIGDTVWYDYSSDGVQQPGEPGIPGVQVCATSTAASIQYCDTTDGNGIYRIVVLAGDYGVAPANPPAGYTLTTPPVPLPVTVAAGDQFLGADFGYDADNLLGTVGNLVWHDINSNAGVFDPGIDLPLAGVSVDLIRDSNGDGVWDPNGVDNIPWTADDEPVIATTTTGSSLDADQGNYLFEGVPANSYLVSVSDTNAVLIDYVKAPLGGAPGADNNNQVDPYPVVVTTPGVSNLTADFAFIKLELPNTGVIGNQVWIEKDGDGIFDPVEGDFGQPGVTVALLDAAGGVVATTTTGASGDYSFVGLAAGTYSVRVTDIYSVLAGLNPTTYPADQVSDNTNKVQPYAVVLSTNDSENKTADLGYFRANPIIQLDKRVYKGWNDGQGCATATDLVQDSIGAQITYCFRVVNTGDTYLDTITVVDADLGIDQSGMTLLNGTAPLAPGAALVYYYETTIQGNLVNTAVGTGQPTDSAGEPLPLPPVSDEDTAEVKVPTPVTLLAGATYARERNGIVQVRWGTADETNIIGFNILRGTAPNVLQAQPINNQLIAARGLDSRGDTYYAFDDRNLAANAAFYFYWIEVVEADGSKTYPGEAMKVVLTGQRILFVPAVSR